MSVTIHLPQFDGPLPLLLYLIRKEEMNILDVDIHAITRQYLDYIKLMRELDLEVAGEFVAMAATLIHIKSMLVLPQYNGQGEEITEAADPRKALVQRLLEYQKFQEASQKLGSRVMLGRDTWGRGVREDWSREEEVIVVEDNGLFSLIATFRQIVRQATKKTHQVGNKLQSIASRIMEIRQFLKMGSRTIFRDLISATEHRSGQVLVTLLSCLELGRLGFVSLFQAEPCGEIYIEPRRAIDHDVITRVKDFEIENRDQLMAGLFASPAAPVAETGELNLEAMESVETPESPAAEPVVLTEALSSDWAATDEDLLAAEQELGLADPTELMEMGTSEVSVSAEAGLETMMADEPPSEIAEALEMELSHELTIEDTEGDIEADNAFNSELLSDLNSDWNSEFELSGDLASEVAPASDDQVVNQQDTSSENLEKSREDIAKDRLQAAVKSSFAELDFAFLTSTPDLPDPGGENSDVG